MGGRTKKFFKKEKEEQKEEAPIKFELRGPVKLLQRSRYASTTIPSQTPRRPRDSRYSQRQPNYWITEYKGAKHGKEYGAGYDPKKKKWPKEIAMERDMVLERKKRWVSPTSQMGLRVKLIILLKDQEGMVSISQ